MSGFLGMNGHKRPLPPPQSRAVVLQELEKVDRWTPVDDELLICAPCKRQKLNHSVSPAINLGVSILRASAKAATATATIRATNQESIEPIIKELPLQNISPQQSHLPADEIPRQDILNDVEGEEFSTSGRSHTTTDQESILEDEEQEATRLAQLVSILAKDTQPDPPALVSSSQAERIRELRSRTEKEGEARSRALRAANLELQSRSSTTNSLGSRMSSVTRQQSTSTSVESTKQSRDSPNTIRQMSKISSTTVLADDIDNEALLDIAQSYARGDSSLEKAGERNQQNTTSAQGTQDGNALSRAAAEAYRTRNRHLDCVASFNDDTAERLAMHEAGARRLMEIKAIQQARTKLVPHAQIVDWPMQDRSSFIQPASRSSFRAVASNPNNWRPLVNRRPVSQPPVLVDAPAVYPPQGSCLVLPKGFDQKSKELQDIITQHEIYKQRLRSLNAIPALIESIAIAGSAKPFNDCEQQELREAKTYLTKVLEEKLCGSRMRKRVLDIRDNMRRRSSSLPSPDSDQTNTLYNTLFRPELQDELIAEKSVLEEKIQSLGNLRSASRNHTKTSKSKSISKRHSEDTANRSRTIKLPRPRTDASVVDDATLDSSDIDTLHTAKLSRFEKRQRQQLMYAAKLEAKELHLRAQLKAFEDQDVKNTGNSRNTANGSTGEDQDDIISEISEEDEGADYYSGTRVANQVNNNTSMQDQDPVRDARVNQLAIEPVTLTSTQHPHESLKQQLQEKRQVQEIRSQQYAQKPNLDLLQKVKSKAMIETLTGEASDIESEGPCDDSDVDSSMFSDDEDRTCYRYHVNICATGIDNLEDGIEYRQFTSLKTDRANEEALLQVDNILKEYTSKLDTKAKKVHKRLEEFRDGLAEYNLALGEDQQIVCRIWVEQEEYSVSPQLFQDARLRRACIPKPVYLVMWKHTTRRCAESVEELGDDIAATQADGGAAIEPVERSEAGNEGKTTEEVTPTETVAPINTQHETPSSSDIHNEDIGIDEAGDDNDDDDELFGAFSPEPIDATAEVLPEDDSDASSISAFTEPLASETPDNIISVDTPSLGDLRITSTIAHANRFAKERFMVWWTSHLRGSANWEYIRHEEKCMEDELKALGNLSTWEKEEEFTIEDDDGITVRDKLRVWIEEKKVYGPAN